MEGNSSRLERVKGCSNSGKNSKRVMNAKGRRKKLNNLFIYFFLSTYTGTVVKTLNQNPVN